MTTPTPSGQPSTTSKLTELSGNSIVTEVQKFLGASYVYGDAGPTSFDCSGLVQYVLKQLGVQNVPRTSEAQYTWATPVSSVSPGTLVFAQMPGDTDPSPGHVGIALGGGNVISAEDPASGVRVSTLSSWQP